MSEYDKLTLEYLKAAGIEGSLLKRVEKSLKLMRKIREDSDVLLQLEDWLQTHTYDDLSNFSGVVEQKIQKLRAQEQS